MNEDYTNEIPPIEGTLSEDEYLDEQEQEVGCECEVDWKCGVCRANGFYHSRLDAAGLGPDAVLSEDAAWADYQRRLEVAL